MSEPVLLTLKVERTEEVYATILYYLQNKEIVSNYMKTWIEHGHKMREQQRLNPPPVSEKLRQLRKERQFYIGDK
ncbi:hypothetical protein H6F47_15710 [Sphaerospermopsis sp. FACHB-1094]|uniref:hypothetical protein n=1 Tax=Sphaerospermopsis sp. FACHB-1094 TaxID=2692861 RepID=UPI001684FF39|nr:hypothetical protein [Sphaerospermopsis sp. FACHB-1094]MBD2133835.1 hypothetical protein [Sphaerospermopsis sp. FACHB-1094]